MQKSDAWHKAGKNASNGRHVGEMVPYLSFGTGGWAAVLGPCRKQVSVAELRLGITCC